MRNLLLIHLLFLKAVEYFVYAMVLAVAMLVFFRMAQGYESRCIEGDDSSMETRPLLHQQSKVQISVLVAYPD